MTNLIKLVEEVQALDKVPEKEQYDEYFDKIFYLIAKNSDRYFVLTHQDFSGLTNCFDLGAIIDGQNITMIDIQNNEILTFSGESFALAADGITKKLIEKKARLCFDSSANKDKKMKIVNFD